jgi:Flp pilus assembly pilin Flp
MIEYAFIADLGAVALVTILGTAGIKVTSVFTSISSQLP